MDKTVDANEENKEIINVKEFSDKFSDYSFSTPLQQIIPVPIRDGEGEIDKIKEKWLEKLFEKTYKDNEVVKEIINAKARGLWKLPTALTKKNIVLSIKDLKIKTSNSIWKTGCTYWKMRSCSYICCSNTMILPFMAIQGIKLCIKKYRPTTFGLRWSNTASSTHPTAQCVDVQRPTQFKNKTSSTNSTVNDCGGQMTAILWRRLCKWYSINIKFYLAHHPKTDGQTKSVNRVMKNYFYAYIAYT